MDRNIIQALDLSTIRWDAQGLVPAIVQDVETKGVLMLAYMNEESLRRTLLERKACYYSRSRQSLWLKGETSGHFQEIVDIKFDCDKDTLLLTVKQIGMACHENYFSCFHYDLTNEGFKEIGEPEVRPELTLGRTLELLTEVIHSRNLERPEGAYTTYLFEKGIDKILKKVGEESAEVIIAAKNSDPDEIRCEVSDLFYHVLVMLEERGVSVEEVSRELLKRRSKD
ncbi:bifunctional phosphoribosyl-AMP cyclohydrolase/phosphoribosyl-ATP diphosphatase HisIE [Desulfosporosinus meridiei]|uniref:Histidine biosynthesis bifunctional protein HisIE n=1 Tax=Desulfosporosinus meridiei (strain ATCC BAA-275 / DSM 13257 / KCTC 12902 / NCIMB 13706 / S10) TaxID=768704 RepID=J7IVT9_DESMD|nr:bifunctional phosphoribosyl-AMP cyclohydrolase/phosphoribosyl-ATP diphosphatase HisIE [Desulfosporosinus meridiei]AFQ42801.1 phosphoribosyl-AMP cyclohydrolase, phosphoribosyl-ATP pyrophosphatase [Desulfosporosinus meridiei DSM 13257]